MVVMGITALCYAIMCYATLCYAMQRKKDEYTTVHLIEHRTHRLREVRSRSCLVEYSLTDGITLFFPHPGTFLSSVLSFVTAFSTSYLCGMHNIHRYQLFLFSKMDKASWLPVEEKEGHAADVFVSQ